MPNTPTLSQNFLTALAEHSQDVVMVCNQLLQTVYLSPAANRILQLNDQPDLGQNLLKYIHPDDLELLRSDIHKLLLKPGINLHIVFRLDRAGDELWLEGEMSNQLHHPDINGLLLYLRNITEQKKADAYLEKMMKELSDYKYALDESSIVAITDQKGIIKHANDNFCKISKYNREELIGQDHRIVNSGYHPKEFIRDLWVTIANGHIWRGDIKNRAKDGSTYWVETTIVPFLNEKGKPYQYVAIRADITQRKKTEEELSRNLEELERSNKELEQFAYIASHDLQEPLRMVGSYMQLIERRYKGQLDKDADEFIHFAMDGANRMKQLIADLLNYSRMNKEGNVVEVDMNEVMQEVLQNLTASIKENKAKVSFDDLPVIKADRTQMLQLLQNLIGNALKFTKDHTKPEVQIKVEKQHNHWLFSVSDNGIGIDQQYADKVFVIFKQLHSKAKYSGTGIGLAIAKKIVERHGGEIWFESEVGHGTTFYFTLKA